MCHLLQRGLAVAGYVAMTPALSMRDLVNRNFLSGGSASSSSAQSELGSVDASAADSSKRKGPKPAGSRLDRINPMLDKKLNKRAGKPAFE